jgi:DNA-directed RNA polymerase specialized sigma24 family protein
MKTRNPQEILKLVKQASQGNKEAYEELHQRYKKTVRGRISSSCFYRDDAIDDIEQDTWEIVWEKISTYEPEQSSFYTFVCFWANIMLKRYFSKRREVPISTLVPQDCDVTAQDILENLLSKAKIFPSDELLAKYEQFLRLTFSKGGPPHQLISFGFNKLLYGWGPQEIVEKLSPVLLERLTDQLISSYKEESCLADYIVKDCFNPLKQKMSEKVKNVLEDQVSRDTYAKLLESKAADTVLKDYYGRDPEHNISDWSNKVGKRVARLSASQ